MNRLCEVIKTFSRNLCITAIVFLVRISSWNCVRVPKAMLWADVHSFRLKFSQEVRFKFQLEIPIINVISGIVYFREIILKSSRNVCEITPCPLWIHGIYLPILCRVTSLTGTGTVLRRPWAMFQYKDSLSQVRDSHVKDKAVAIPSYLWHGDPYTSKTTSLYWDPPPPPFLQAYDKKNYCACCMQVSIICEHIWSSLTTCSYR